MVTTANVEPNSGFGRSTGRTDELAELVRAFKALFDPYRPELHYMRGPGPKWHAKHDRMAARFDAMAVPAVARVRVKR